MSKDISSKSHQSETDANNRKLEKVNDDLSCCDESTTDDRSHTFVNLIKNTVMNDNKDLQVLEELEITGLKSFEFNFNKFN